MGVGKGEHRVGWVNGGGKGGVVRASFKNPPFLQMVI